MPRERERHLEVAEARVDGRPVGPGQGRDLAARQRPLGHEQQRLELRLGRARRVGWAEPSASASPARRARRPPLAPVGASRRSVSRRPRRRVLGALVGSPRRARVAPSSVMRTTPATRPTAPPRRRSPTRLRRAPRAVVRRATIGPHGSACSTTISRRFISSSIARNVTAATTRSRTPASSSWSTIAGAPRSASRMIARSRGQGHGATDRLGRRRRRRDDPDQPFEGPGQQARRQRRGPSGCAPARAAARAAPGSRWNSPSRRCASSSSRAPASRYAR